MSAKGVEAAVRAKNRIIGVASRRAVPGSYSFFAGNAVGSVSVKCLISFDAAAGLNYNF